MVIREDMWANLDLRLAGRDGDAVGAAEEELRRDERSDVDGHLHAVLLLRCLGTLHRNPRSGRSGGSANLPARRAMPLAPGIWMAASRGASLGLGLDRPPRERDWRGEGEREICEMANG